HRADEDHPHRRAPGPQEPLAPALLEVDAGIAPQRVGGRLAFAGLEDPLLAALEVGRQDYRLLGARRSEETLQRRPLHSTGSTKMRMRPPQASPTFQAVSSVTPNSSERGLRSAMTASPASTTAPSTHPADTEPTKALCSFTASRLPTGRGDEPQVSTTVASATPIPPSR